MFGIRSILINATQLSLARLISQVVRIVYVIALARYLGPEVYGLFAYGQSWYMAFLPLTLFGLGAILSREVGRDRDLGARTVRQVALFRILTSGLVAIVSVGIGWSIDVDPIARQLILVFSFALVGRTIAVTAEEIFSAYERSGYVLQQEAIFRPLEVVAGLAVLAAGGGAVLVAAVHAVVWWLQAARGWHLAHHNLVRLFAEWTRPVLRTLLAQAGKVGVTGILWTWLVQGPLVMFRFVSDSEASLGQLALAMQAFLLLCAVPWAINRAALPVLSRAAGRSDNKDALFADVMTRAGLLIGTAAGLAGMTLGPWLIQAIFGAGYLPTGELLGPAFWLLIPLTVATSATHVLIARGSFLRVGLSTFAGALVLTGSLFPLAREMGPEGALLATGMGLGTSAICLCWLMRHFEGIDFARMVYRPGLVVLAAILFYIAADLSGAEGWPALLAGVIALLVGTLKFVLSPEERAEIRATLARSEFPLFR